MSTTMVQEDTRFIVNSWLALGAYKLMSLIINVAILKVNNM